MATEGQTLEQQLEELLDQETFAPPEGFGERAVAADPAVYERGDADYEAYWAEEAKALDWDTPWDTVLDWSNPPFAKWFVGGKLNVSHNCVDRHVAAGRGDRVAYHWRGEEGEELDVTYADLHRDVQRLANGLKDLGVAKGDVVGIYLPMSRSRCSRARASARSTTSSSAASAPSRCASGWSSPRPRR
jgi:acetyl-CoA synthetase